MHWEEDCECGQQGEYPGRGYEDRGRSVEEDCGCGGHRHHDSFGGWHGHHGCRCGCHHHHEGMLHRHFISREEVISQLEEYLKQLQAEAAGVEERIAELKRRGESR